MTTGEREVISRVAAVEKGGQGPERITIAAQCSMNTAGRVVLTSMIA